MTGPVERVDWIVVGGGFAGLATAHALGAAGLGRGPVLEREPLCGSHASGRNAAIFRLADPGTVVGRQAERATTTPYRPGGNPSVRNVGCASFDDLAREISVEIPALR